MFKLFFLCVKNFGLRGLIIYVQLKFRATKNIMVPGIQYPISLRNTSEDQYTFREIFIKKEYDFDLPTSIIPKTIIDAGANIGLTSIYFANKYKTSVIYSIEPDTPNFIQLKSNTAPYSRIVPIQGALWHTHEHINLVDKGLGNRGYMVEKLDQGSIEGLSVPDIMTRYQLGEIDILKIDIEGSEKEVFSENYETWLPHTKCIVIELHDRMKRGCSKAVFNAFARYDFSVAIKGENLVFINSRHLDG